MWEDSSYCWVVTCKHHIYHIPRNLIYRHKIPLAEADAVTSRPPINGPFRARCDMCGKEYLYKPSEVLRAEKELPEGFIAHPAFREEQGSKPDTQQSRLDLSLLIKGQLLSQEEDLHAQGCARADKETEEKKAVRDQIGDQGQQRIQ